MKARIWNSWAVVDSRDPKVAPWFSINGGYLYQLDRAKPKCSSSHSRVVRVEIREVLQRKARTRLAK